MGVIERFEKFINKDGEGGCHIWTGSKRYGGYGQFGFFRYPMAAHRLSYLFYIGSIPKGMFVLHKCDNPACVNPDHLFLGTQADNMADKARKGRARGENHPGAKLSEQDVQDIRASIASGERNSRIARRYGVCDATIRLIETGKNWGFVPADSGAIA